MNKIYESIVKSLPKHPAESRHGIWVNSDYEIMCCMERDADVIAYLLEEMNLDIVHTFYYDEEEDGLNFGWWAVYID